MNKFIFILAFALCGPAGAATFAGSLKSSTDFYSTDLGKPTDQTTPYFQFDLASKHKFSNRLRLQWKLLALSNVVAEGKGSTEESPFNEQLYLDLPEAYVERKWGSSKLRLGMNTVNWGVVDGYSPSNVINTSAYFHPLRTPKRGSPTVELQSGGEALGAHAIYIPRQPRGILPAVDSRWLPRDVLVNLGPGLPRVAIPDDFEYEYGSEIELDHARDNNYGLKLNSHTGSWDFQVTHFEGASPFPKIRPSLRVISTPGGFVAQTPYNLDPVTYRIRNSGMGVTYAGEKWIYRFESAYTHTVSDGATFGIQPWCWANVAGVETNIEVGRSALTVIAQYYHTDVSVKADNYISSSYRLFDRTGALVLRWPVNDAWMVHGSTLIETKTHGLFWTAGVEQKIKDVFKWGVGWRDFSAQDPGLIKTFDKNDHVNLDLTYFF